MYPPRRMLARHHQDFIFDYRESLHIHPLFAAVAGIGPYPNKSKTYVHIHIYMGEE